MKLSLIESYKEVIIMLKEKFLLIKNFNGLVNIFQIVHPLQSKLIINLRKNKIKKSKVKNHLLAERLKLRH